MDPAHAGGSLLGRLRHDLAEGAAHAARALEHAAEGARHEVRHVVRDAKREGASHALKTLSKDVAHAADHAAHSLERAAERAARDVARGASRAARDAAHAVVDGEQVLLRTLHGKDKKDFSDDESVEEVSEERAFAERPRPDDETASTHLTFSRTVRVAGPRLGNAACSVRRNRFPRRRNTSGEESSGARRRRSWSRSPRRAG